MLLKLTKSFKKINPKSGFNVLKNKKIAQPPIFFTGKKTYMKAPKDMDEDEAHGTATEQEIADLMLKSKPQDFTAKIEHAFSVKVIDKDEYVLPRTLIENDMKTDPEFYAYKTKYPEENYNDWIRKVEQLYLDDTPVTEQFIDDVTELSGFAREDVVKMTSKRIPEFVEYDQNGDFHNIRWDNVKAEFKFDPRVNNVIDQIDTSYNMLLERDGRRDEIVANTKYFNWQEKEKSGGEEKVLLMRERYRELFKNSYRTTDPNETIGHLNTVFNPIIDKCKDELIDSFPLFQRISQQSKSVSRQLELDDEGVPVWEFTSLEFIDTFYPEVRDEVLVEVDNFDFDIEYKDQFKQLSHQSTDDLFTLVSDEYWRGIIDKTAVDFFRSYEDVTESKRVALVNKAKMDLDEKIEDNLRLSQLVSKLKSQLEYVEDVKETKKDEDKIDPEKGNEILRSVGIDPEGKLVVVKDWKHKPHEIVEEDRSPVVL